MGTGSTEKLRFNFIRDDRILRVSQKAGSAIQLSVDILSRQKVCTGQVIFCRKNFSDITEDKT